MSRPKRSGAANRLKAAPHDGAALVGKASPTATGEAAGGAPDSGAASKSASHGRTGKGPNAGSWQPGQSGNLAGAPKRGDSWREVIRAVGDKTLDEAVARFPWLAAKIPAEVMATGVGDRLSLKELIVVNVFAALIVQPDSALWNGLMNRAEGYPEQPLERTWKSELAEWVREGKVGIEEIRAHLSDELFAEFTHYLGPVVASLEAAGDHRKSR